MRILDTILNLVLPAHCVACGKTGTDLCRECLSNFPPAERETANWIFPLFDYHHAPVKKSIWLLKYKNRKRLARVFADVLYGKIMEELSDIGAMENFREPILIPVPLSEKRYQERGYNQAELICRELIKLDATNPDTNLNLRYSVDRESKQSDLNKLRPNGNFQLEKNILIKTKETERQVNIKDRAKRLKNLAGSFAVGKPELIRGRNIILIDDVTTTGATLTEAKRVLKRSGAKKVIAFTIAH